MYLNCRHGTFLSTTAAWMKNWPQGVSVVPMAAMTVKIHRLSHEMYGCVAPWSAALQSGPARMPETT